LIWIKHYTGAKGHFMLPVKPMEQTLCEIEAAQEKLRDSIERTRDLTEETARLVLKHRSELPAPPNPVSR
jgi:hypothetical protein